MGDRFCDAVVLARHLHDHIGTFKKDSVEGVSQSRVISVFDLINYAKDQLTAEIGKPYEVIVEKTPLLKKQYGMYLRYANRVEISISANLNSCWSRFVSCKEIMHLLCDNDEKHFAKDPLSQIQSALQRATPIGGADELDSEDFAFYAAFEFLYPWQTRYKAAVGSGGLTNFQVADQFKIPEKVIDIHFHTGHGRLSDEVNNGLR